MDREEKKKILEELGGIPEELYNELVHDFLASGIHQLEHQVVFLLAPFAAAQKRALTDP